ncbi:hypothetical protein DWW84_07690 [Bifidobacterium pseudocatenulatum]|uniref:hypothetical protein n=1 Tax=Bifidobacterium pseudocatenulatum TaxID=28026 RepID=UPI000E4BE287|nr:hypothetical protein [Bifidobacterium pseudocatenulatum]RGU31650.1 hypothetical protein DWW84_07690 [Bifidobacterium pseudocatenulatum]
MRNPAQYLLQMFNASQRDEGQTFTVRDAVAAMTEIEKQAAMLEAGGDSALPVMRRAFPEIWEKIFRSFLRVQNNNFNMDNVMDQQELSLSAQIVLVQMRKTAPFAVSTFTVEQRESARDFAREFADAVKNDLTLPNDLKTYVAALVVQIQSNLEQYEMTGDFVLADSLNKLFAAVFMAETQTRDKSRWQKFKEEKATPFMQVFLSLALPNVLSAAQLVLQITQG